MMLAQAKVAAASADKAGAKSASCLTCLRNTKQKYCYDPYSSIASSTCCEMDDFDTDGCN